MANKTKNCRRGRLQWRNKYNVTEDVTNKVVDNGGVNGGVNDILLLIENNPGINVSNIKSLLNVPQRTIERWINQLKKENKIEFKGAPKTGGYYRIIG